MARDVEMEVMVDWNATDWAATPDFSEDIDDITDDFINMGGSRGKEKESGNIPAGTVDIELRNLAGKYHPRNTSSPLYGLIRPMLPIRIRETSDEETVTLYTGFISKIKIPDQRDVRTAHLYCTDGLDIISRNLVSQDEEELTTQSDGDSIGDLLDAAGWPSGKRNIDTDGGDVLQYPKTREY